MLLILLTDVGAGAGADDGTTMPGALLDSELAFGLPNEQIEPLFGRLSDALLF